MAYADDDMLKLSGIQHFMFCPRQWALIHIEQLWTENHLTAEGQLLHTNVDNPAYRQKNGNVITLRSVHVASSRLGLYGITDAVELHPAADGTKGITHSRYPGNWMPYPVEYKHGRPKHDECDLVQLVAQVMCLEEMYGIDIEEAALYYASTSHRMTVTVTDELRRLTVACAEKMHEVYVGHTLPKPVEKPGCRNCSLVDQCLPQSLLKVKNYLDTNLYEEVT